MRRLLILPIVLLLGAPLISPASAAAPAGAAAPDRFIVTFADGTQRARQAPDLATDLGVPIGPRALAVRMSAAAAQALARRHGVVRVEPDVVFHTFRVPNDPCQTSCAGGSDWAIANVRAPLAWDYNTGAGVTIGILDSGIDTSHPDLAGKVVGPEIDETGGAGRDPGHGTAVAGTAAAVTDNGQGIPGIGWDSKILDVRVIDDSGGGLGSWVAQGIYDATARGVQVINLSLGSPEQSAALGDAVAYAEAHGIVVVAALGNDGNTTVNYPAAFPGVIGVGATTQSNTLASFSDRGPFLDIAAPGASLPAPQPGGGYKLVSGTSFSAPLVSGAAALLVAQGLEPDAASVAARLMQTSVPLGDGSGARRLDVGAAVAALHAYPGFTGGTSVATGDVSPAAGTEVITGAGRGGGPNVRVFGADFTPISGFFAYDPGFRGGVDVAAGNTDGGAQSEIVTSPGAGGGPDIRVYRADGTLVSSLLAYDPGFRGGVRVATGDVDGDGKAEIITGPGPGGGPDVRIFKPDGTLVKAFFAYDAGFHGGVSVAAADVDGDGKAEIITAAGPGGGPHVRVFRADGTPLNSFFAYDTGFHGGVNVATFRVGGGGGTQIITGPMAGGGPDVRLYNPSGTLIGGRFGFPRGYTGGVDVALGAGGPFIAEAAGDTIVRMFPLT